jgi:hypothetical protein
MRFTLVWKPSASDDLVALWLDAPPGSRERFRQVVDDIERALMRDPLSIGESRDEQVRMVVEPPVVLVFEVSLDDRRVCVLAIRSLESK